MIVAQSLAVIIFIAMFILIIMDKIERQYITLACGMLTLILVFGIAMRDVDAIIETLNVKIFLLWDFGILPEARKKACQELTGRPFFLLRV